MDRSLFLFVIVCISLHVSTHAQRRRQPRCERGSCNPATGDLLIGRELNLTATSTCGVDYPQRYCVVSYLQGDTKCFTCDSRQPWRRNITENSHQIENVISSFKQRKKTRWWQAETGVERASIRLDLEAEFRFTHLIMTFKTFRPKAMLIERSYNFGKDWKVYRYFAQNCDEAFPGVPKRVVNSLSDVICDERYSAETPSTTGEVIFRVLPPFIPIPDPYSEAVQDLLKLTNLRINFTELHTLGDTLLDSRPEIKEKYYYAVYDITVRGSCSCYGHASRCLPVPGYNRSADTSRIMVHGQCDCTHNTKGLNCEMCQDFYHDTQWKPARPNQPNICKKCNCNNHATACHFDASIYEASGRISGGVCDNCTHNTRGIHCEECKNFFFQDPNRDIRDPEICQPCDCDSYGSKNNGLCEQITDEIASTKAGRCICKQFVTGARCDRCQQNYWNLEIDNPLGCEPCSCNPDGVVDDVGCDEDTGLCRCKRYVTGRDCDECYPGFYGLSADNSYGCKSCDCDIGGAASSACDKISGQCECRPRIRGKRCMAVDPGFFYAHLDHYLYEAEYGVGHGNARVYIREPIPNAPSYWTGPGYMKVMEGDSLEFTVSGLPFSTHYDLVLRYDPRMPEVFEDISVSLIRPGQVDPDGLCGDFSPRDDLKIVSLQPSARYSLVSPPSCLEKDMTYKVRIDFNSYKRGRQNKAATLLIDSLLVVPNVDYIPIYQGPGLPEYMKNEFLYNRCDNSQYSSVKLQLTEQCLKHTFSISAVFHNGALDCDCDRTGSTSVECDPSGGQCECKPNVVGRRCDQCAPGTYGFGPQGCSSCNCHEIGARDNFCEKTGQCFCISNVDGRACDQCRVGFWGFPQCRPCQCNGNAETCDPLTGACIDCKNNTAGDYCERCEDSYYGEPRFGVRIPCRPCMCPNGPNSTVQHADGCNFDPRSQEVYCNCKPGYTGRNCDACIDNYYGLPKEEGGACEPCVCNNNINVDDPGSCDGSTGECQKCLYNTEGFACEHCMAGFHGNATHQSCGRCVCNDLGTDEEQGECDRVTGQCPCFPNVDGVSCDKCAPEHWNMTSGEGCTACNCDSTGATNLECNQLDGQCDCIPGRGGMQCRDCEDFMFGNPIDQCYPCDCDPQGSESLQCDRTTGKCMCVEGVTGYKCDRCARGTTGDLPNCVPCGECFDNWDGIIMDLKDQTHDIVKRANDVSVTGAIKAFDEEFRQMQHSIDEIKQILSNVNFTQGDIQSIQDMLDAVKSDLTDNTKSINQVDADLRKTNGRVKKGKILTQLLKNKVENLKRQAQELKDNATNIQIREVGGAFEKIKEAERQSQDAQNKVDETDKLLQSSAKIRQDTEQFIQDRQQAFKDQLKSNLQSLDMLEDDILKLGGNMSDINAMVCGEPGAPCSSLCGGGGCGKCGGVGCNGAVTMAQTALNLVHQAEDLLNAKTANASQVLVPQIQNARRDAMTAKMDAQDAYDEAAKAKNVTEDTRAELEALLERIKGFLIGKDRPKPSDVEKVIKSIMEIEIPLKPEQIQEMADKINKAVSSLTDIPRILNETSDSRAKAEDLKKQAEEASDDAEAIRNTAQNVRDALDEAKMKQDKAEMAIEKAKKDIQEAEDNLRVIESTTGEVDGLTKASLAMLEQMKDRLDDLTRRYTGIKVDTLNKAQQAADTANDLANDALKKAKDLESNYAATENELNDKFEETKQGKELAEKLKERADKIYKFTETKLSQLKDIKEKLEGNEEKLNKLDEEINRLNMLMDKYLKEIKDKARGYDTC